MCVMLDFYNLAKSEFVLCELDVCLNKDDVIFLQVLLGDLPLLPGGQEGEYFLLPLRPPFFSSLEYFLHFSLCRIENFLFIFNILQFFFSEMRPSAQEKIIWHYSHVLSVIKDSGRQGAIVENGGHLEEHGVQLGVVQEPSCL